MVSFTAEQLYLMDMNQFIRSESVDSDTLHNAVLLCTSYDNTLVQQNSYTMATVLSIQLNSASPLMHSTTAQDTVHAFGCSAALQIVDTTPLVSAKQ